MTARLDSKSTTVSLDIRMPLTLKKKIQKAADKSDMKVSEYVRFLLANNKLIQEM